MITRAISSVIQNRAKKMPVICITGPRQSGKTTLVKQLFQEYRYVSLEETDNRLFAKEDPRGFLKRFQSPVIIDEAQYVPELFSYIQTDVDHSGRNGEYILTGSQNFLLLQSISQSLAGRAAIFHLLPFSIAELIHSKYKTDSYEDYLLNGFYPRIYDKALKPSEWLPDYIQLYVQRDVRQIINVTDLDSFVRFIRLCAGRTGQLLNLSSLGNEAGVSHHTAKSWISILQTSFIVFLLQPYHKNFNKRIVKSPKLYFYDSGLACSLLGIKSKEELETHYHKGALFENMMIGDLVKNDYNKGRNYELYFWRDSTGNEIDCLMGEGRHFKSIEIKTGRTVTGDYFGGLENFNSISKGKPENSYVIYGGNSSMVRNNMHVISWMHTEKLYGER